VKPAETPKPAASTTPAPAGAPSRATAQTTSAPTTPSPAITATQASTYGQDALLSGSEYQKATQNLIEMGFEKEQVIKAMRAAFNNPDRAVEYLMSGIPDQPVEPEAPVGAGETVVPNAQQAGEMMETDANSPFEALRQIPQFDQLRQMILTQPQLLEPMLAQLGQSHPHLLEAIATNPDGFLQWLAMAGGEGGEGHQVITLSEEEGAAIDRLVALGFDRQMAVEAYLACDKNEMLAANYLFDMGSFDDE
jgi:UV excision repair protein RAD23